MNDFIHKINFVFNFYCYSRLIKQQKYIHSKKQSSAIFILVILKFLCTKFPYPKYTVQVIINPKTEIKYFTLKTHKKQKQKRIFLSDSEA